MIWKIAASASALPCPKRWSSSAGIDAIHTPVSVARLAIRSSAESARLPSMAVEPVRQLAQLLSATSTSATVIDAIAAERASQALL